MGEAIDINWFELTQKIARDYECETDLNGILFIIGIQERGWGFRKYNKAEKWDLIDLATITVLSRKGYYEKKGADEEGWPEWQMTLKGRMADKNEIEPVLKEAILEYFREKEYIQ